MKIGVFIIGESSDNGKAKVNNLLADNAEDSMVGRNALKSEAFKNEKPDGLFIHEVDITNLKDVEDLNTIINSFDNLDYQRNTSLGFHRFYSRGEIINVQSIADTFSCVLSDKASWVTGII